MRGALLAGAAGLAQAMPSFRERLPNAYGVECPGDHWEGCTSTGLCMGLGHTQCAGGGALGAFGVSFLQHGYEWTTDMCEDDADGDGQSNGRELGDPCCLWEPRATLPAAYEALMASWHKTHPGDPAHTSRSDVADALCDAYGPDDVVREYPGFFTPNETARAVNYSYELTVANYEIPAWRTIYADFIWDAPQEHMDRCAGENSCYLVGLEAIIDESRHVHHYILNGCKEPWAAARDDYSPGMAREVGFGVGCRWQFGGWAPGKNPFYEPPKTASRDMSGLTGFSMQVHYDNPDEVAGVVDASGFRVHYATEPREHVLGSIRGLRLSVDFGMLIPPKRKRWFLTRTCYVSGVEEDTIIQGVGFHAHLLGREMYSELWRDGKQVDLQSEESWYFDDQYDKDISSRGLRLKNGDMLQSTCVYDSSERDKDTYFGPETSDEMCWVTLVYLPYQRSIACDGASWNGVLRDGDDPRLIPLTHPHPDQPPLEVACDTSHFAKHGTDAAAVDAVNEACAGSLGTGQECVVLLTHVERCYAERDDQSPQLAARLAVLHGILDDLKAGVGVAPGGCEDDGSWHKRNVPGKDCAWVALAASSRCGLMSENDVAARDACPCACDPEGPTARPAPRPTRAYAPPTAPVAAPTPRPSRPTVYKRPSTDPALSANGETTVTYNGKRNRSKSGDDMRDGLFVFAFVLVLLLVLLSVWALGCQSQTRFANKEWTMSPLRKKADGDDDDDGLDEEAHVVIHDRVLAPSTYALVEPAKSPSEKNPLATYDVGSYARAAPPPTRPSASPPPPAEDAPLAPEAADDDAPIGFAFAGDADAAHGGVLSTLDDSFHSSGSFTDAEPADAADDLPRADSYEALGPVAVDDVPGDPRRRADSYDDAPIRASEFDDDDEPVDGENTHPAI